MCTGPPGPEEHSTGQRKTALGPIAIKNRSLCENIGRTVPLADTLATSLAAMVSHKCQPPLSPKINQRSSELRQLPPKGAGAPTLVTSLKTGLRRTDQMPSSPRVRQ